MEDAAIIDLYWARDQRAIAESDGKYGTLLPPFGAEYPDGAGGRGGVRQRHLGPGLEHYAAPAAGFPAGLLGRIVRNLSLDLWRRNHA